MMLKKTVLLLIITASICRTNAQDNSLLNMLSDSMSANKTKSFVTGTFKATHVINMQTVEGIAAGALSFVIQHRFGQLNSGAYNLFGLDNATLRLGLDYGITNRFTVGIGRSSYQKTFDSYAKYKLFRQTDGTNQTPISATILGIINYYTLNYPDKPYLNSTYRTSYIGQVLIARKFSPSLSIQIAPTYLHYNLVPTIKDKNDVFSFGFGGRMKLSKRMSLNAEYNYLLPNQVVSTTVYNSFSVGWDIETGGHVFQLVMTNSQGMAESQYIGGTTDSWGNGGIYFGFNISRNFNISNHAKNKTATW